MAHLPPTLLELITVGGVVSALGALLAYSAKKGIDIFSDVVRARLLKERPKDSLVLYGPDGRVIKRLRVDSP
jgi:hypothetical protein